MMHPMSISPRERFLGGLAAAPFLLDGATGTELMLAGLAPGEPPERWVLERPDAVRALARGYAQAGANAVYACTFGANRIRLARWGAAERACEIAARAVALARAGVAGGA